MAAFICITVGAPSKRETSPAFENLPKVKEKIQWLKPKLVCEIAFAEWTDDGELRQTSFLGWRNDKKPEEIVLEQS